MAQRRKIKDVAESPQKTKQTRTAPAPARAKKAVAAISGYSGDSKGEKTAFLEVRRMALSDLDDHPRNTEVRKHPEPGTPRWDTLKKSLEHDYFDPIVWNVRNGQLVSGHLRKKVMLHEGLYTHAMVVVVDYDEPTHLARLLAANRGMGTTDLEGQASFLAELKGVGDGFDVSLSGFSLEEADCLLEDPFSDTGGSYQGRGDEDEEGDDREEGEDDSLDDIPPEHGTVYSSKIKAPVYEPRGNCPPLSELVNVEKSTSMEEEISKAKLPEDVKDFLRMAAARHRVFDYEKIAEYYCHATKRVQQLMEKSALVIIDFDKALENGFIKLSESIKKAYVDNPAQSDKSAE